ncbi:MAG TPA: chemotaxis protein CheW [Pyrinomonadaceae bacterium]|jgi:purine-binding chemotaxis protein CheW
MTNASDKKGEPVDVQEFVVVRLEDEYFAFDVADVAEVLPYSEPVRLPRAPKFLTGLVDVRGVMLPVVDLRLRAELSNAQRPRHILAIRLDERFIGALVDEVCEVYSAEDGSVASVASLGDKLDAQYVSRALRWGQRLVPVMDAVRLLTTDETIRLKRLRSPRRRKGERN